jgi:hypothetical protein
VCHGGLSGGLVYRSMSDGPGPKYRSLCAAPDPVEEEEAPIFRSAGGLAAAAAPAEEETADDEAVLVVTVETPPDTSSDAAIAAAVQEEEGAPSTAPPKVGDKRTISTSDRDISAEPATNMSPTRQSRAPKSCGVAPKISQEVERSTKGCVVVTETISVALQRGTGPTEADLIALDALVGERIEAAKKAGGVTSVKKLSGVYAEKMGAVSSAPLSTQTKCDIAATAAATVNGAIAVGVPLGMENLF